MKKIKILNNEKSMPLIGLGTWLSQPGEVYKIVIEAIKCGYRHIDCAACYGNEAEIGEALTFALKNNIVEREELYITSKLWNNAHKKENILPALKKTLKDLKLDYLDLYLIHWPVCFKEDVMFPAIASEYIALDEIPIIETYTAMEQAHHQGLIKSLGVSNFSQKKLTDLIANAKIKPVVNQIEMHPYLAQNNLLDYCNKNQITVTCYSPLGSSGRPAGMLASNEPSLIENELIQKIAKKYQKSPAQIILNWSLSRGTVVIPKTVTPKRALENIQAYDFEIEKEDIEVINKLDCHFRYVNGSFFTPEGAPYTIKNLWDE